MKVRTTLLIAMIFLAALSRVVPHPWNFAPITAMALFGAAHFHSRWMAFGVPLAAMLLSDVGLEITYRLGLGENRGYHELVGVVYGAFILIAAMGLWLRGRTTVPRVAGTVVTSSLFFFLVTNFAVWAFTTDAPFPEGYSKSWDGLIQCYVNALPYLGWTLLGDAVFSTVLFGGFALAANRWPTLRPAPAVVA